MSLADDLRAARALIDTPEKWCQCSFSWPATSAHGPRYCAVGALEGAGLCFVYTERTDLTDLLAAELPDLPSGVDRGIDWASARDRGRLIHRFNDHPATTHNDVLALFNRAIAAAEANP